MLRTMLLSRPAWMLWVFGLSVPGAAAGPIFTQATGTPASTPWVQGPPAATPTAASSTGLGGGASQTSFWVEVQPGGLGAGRRRIRASHPEVRDGWSRRRSRVAPSRSGPPRCHRRSVTSLRVRPP